MGFMVHDYVNFGFDEADVIVSVGYELQEFAPVRINPRGDKQIIHLHRFAAVVDANYNVAVDVAGDIPAALDALAARVTPKRGLVATDKEIRCLLREELEKGRRDESYPLKPQRLVADIRAALGREDFVLVDSGAVKMWMARLYPTYRPNTCLVSNGLSTMGFALPGALGVKLAFPRRKVLAVTGDGGFLMNSQEMETALREKIPVVILVWVDGSYGLIKWKMEMKLHRATHVDFGNPDTEDALEDLFRERFDRAAFKALEERVEMLKAVTAHLESVTVESFAGLLVDYVRQHPGAVVLRGLRAVSDFEYEFQMSLTNRELDGGLETIFMLPSLEYTYLRASLVKEVAHLGGDVSRFVPPLICDRLIQRCRERRLA